MPTKIDAGWKFQRRKPRSAPASAKQRIATYGAPEATVRLTTPSVSAAMTPIPDDRPSRPSMKLMLLIIPVIQMIVNPAAITPPKPSKRIRPGPNGLAM